MKLNQVIEGWKNKLLPAEDMKEQINTVVSERMAICRACPLNSIHAGPVNQLRFDEHCTKCHCTLSAKTACLSCSCPDDKWKAVQEPQKTEDNEKAI